MTDHADGLTDLAHFREALVALAEAVEGIQTMFRPFQAALRLEAQWPSILQTLEPLRDIEGLHATLTAQLEDRRAAFAREEGDLTTAMDTLRAAHAQQVADHEAAKGALLEAHATLQETQAAEEAALAAALASAQRETAQTIAQLKAQAREATAAHTALMTQYATEESEAKNRAAQAQAYLEKLTALRG